MIFGLNKNMKQIKIKLVTIIDQSYDSMFSGVSMVKISMSPI